MEFFPAPLENLVEQFAKLPGVGVKSAQRLAFHVLSMPEDEAAAFAQAILTAKSTIHCCPVCQNLTQGEGPCSICSSPRRDASTICVVADPKDVVAMERSREYQGLYHVLHGVISPMNHVGPDDLHIKSLVEGGGYGHVPVPAAASLWREGDAAGLRHPGGQPPGVCRRRHPHEGSGGAAGNVREKKEFSCEHSRNRLNSPSGICGR